jgi:4-hydroxy-tetrahydrodipicolinate reductase
MIAPLMADCDIVECHHKQKVDAPSATSLYTKKTLEAVRGAGADPIAISSIRNNGFIASQEVYFGQPGERLCVSHHTASREAFMPGLLMVCGKIKEKPGLTIGLEAFMA